MRRIALGYRLSVILGMAVGFLIPASEFLEATLGGLVLACKASPACAGCLWRCCGSDLMRRPSYSWW